MQSEQAGRATLIAACIRIAVGQQNQWIHECRHINGLTNIAVNRSSVDHILVPYDRVNALHKASKPDPDHVQASARIPG